MFGQVFSWLRTQTLEERDRWALWFPVSLGMGAACYFAMPMEPPVFGLGAAFILVSLLLFIIGRRQEGSGLALILVAYALTFVVGIGLAQISTWRHDTPMLSREWRAVTVEGRLVEIRNREKGVQYLLDNLVIADRSAAETPRQIRLSVRGQNQNIPIGARLSVRATLLPPSSPVMPGAYDFRRHAFFERVGAYGFALGAPQIIAPPQKEDGTSLFFENLRQSIAQKTDAVLTGDAAAITTALLTGEQTEISEETLTNMRNAGIVHILSISGLHISLVAGLIFFLLRAAMAAMPSFALRFSVKKIAAVLALLAMVFYTLLVGAPVPTVRSSLMTGLIFLAILVDRRALTLRVVAIAALVILLIAPENVLSPSFQLSFAAVTAMIAFYESTQKTWLSMQEGGSVARKFALYFCGVLLTTLLATVATAPFTIYHFQQMPWYGAISNFFAVPLTTFWIMPLALLSYPLLPFGLADPVLQAMGWGVEGLMFIAERTASLPYAVAAPPPLAAGALAIIVMGGIWWCLWRRPWRHAGAALILVGFLSLSFVKMPLAVVAEDGKSAAVKLTDGRYAWLGARDSFMAEQWQKRLGGVSFVPEKEAIENPGLGLRCDALGCLQTMAEQRLTYPKKPEALIEDCGAAQLIIADFPVPKNCKAKAIDLWSLRHKGAHQVFLTADGLRIETVRDAEGQRPWIEK